MENPLLSSPDHPIRLSVFEGPLDLLLFLIRKQEIDIYDIPVEQVTEQYLAVLRENEKVNLETAGEFFVMAATLMEIKSRMLLPKSEQVVPSDKEDEEIDPRWELVHQLLEYKKFKEAASELDSLIREQGKRVPRHVKTRPSDLGPRPVQKSDKMELWNALNQVLRRLSDRLVVGEIHEEKVTVAERMEYILEVIRQPGPHALTQLFQEKTTVILAIYTFLACLELARLEKIRIWQKETFSEIYFEGHKENELVKNPDTLMLGGDDGGK